MPCQPLLDAGGQVVAIGVIDIESEVPALGVSLRDDTSQVGSGSLPGEALPTTLVALTAQDSPSALARRLRFGDPPVYTRIVDDMVCLDPRTIQTDEEDWLLAALKGNA